MAVGGQQQAPAALPPQERPGTHCTGGWVGPTAGLGGGGKSRPPPGFDPRTVQPVASRYTDWDMHTAGTVIPNPIQPEVPGDSNIFRRVPTPAKCSKFYEITFFIIIWLWGSIYGNFKHTAVSQFFFGRTMLTDIHSSSYLVCVCVCVCMYVCFIVHLRPLRYGVLCDIKQFWRRSGLQAENSNLREVSLWCARLYIKYSYLLTYLLTDSPTHST